MAASTRRYVALLRGVSPMNAKMAELRACFEAAGFTNVVTVLASGNVVFDAKRTPVAKLEKAVEAAMKRHLAHPFPAIVRSLDDLADLLEDDPYAAHRLPKKAKRVVTFLRAKPKAHGLDLPLTQDGASVLAVRGAEVLSAYVPSPKGPVFMRILEKTFGKDVTTRTWDTIAKIAVRAVPFVVAGLGAAA